MSVPSFISFFMVNFHGIVSRPCLSQLSGLLCARILTSGPSTLTHLARVYGRNPYNTAWHKVISRYAISLWPMAFVLIKLLMDKFHIESTLIISVDDTTCLHKGPKVFGRGKHRDAVRSSAMTLVNLFGHKWIVVCLNVKIASSCRTWALPIAVGLYRTPEMSKELGLRHKTPAQIARLLIAKIQRRFRQFSIIVVGDQGYGQHETAKMFSGNKATLVSKFYPDAVLHELPGSSYRCGRKRIVGKRLPKPEQVVQSIDINTVNSSKVTWYGGKLREVKLVSGVGHWYRIGKGLVFLRWVFVRDCTGTHRDEFFYTTDPTMLPEEIVSLYTSRWAIETTFQECKGLLRVEKTRVWCERSVLTLPALLFGAYSVLVLLTVDLGLLTPGATWPAKKAISFSDMIASLRMKCWTEVLFSDTQDTTGMYEIHTKKKNQIINALCLAA
jgi:DDE superfamily endonuclease